MVNLLNLFNIFYTFFTNPSVIRIGPTDEINIYIFSIFKKTSETNTDVAKKNWYAIQYIFELNKNKQNKTKLWKSGDFN